MITLLLTPSLGIGLKLSPSCWCWPFRCSEAGWTAIQVGGLIVEIAH